MYCECLLIASVYAVITVITKCVHLLKGVRDRESTFTVALEYREANSMSISRGRGRGSRIESIREHCSINCHLLWHPHLSHLIFQRAGRGQGESSILFAFLWMCASCHSTLVTLDRQMVQCNLKVASNSRSSKRREHLERCYLVIATKSMQKERVNS